MHLMIKHLFNNSYMFHELLLGESICGCEKYVGASVCVVKIDTEITYINCIWMSGMQS